MNSGDSKIMNSTIHKQKGAASIFIVVFFGILIGVITLSFTTIVNQDQQQSTNNDLAQSAYDSAQAGVEDGKRFVRKYKECRVDSACSNVSTGEITDYETYLNKEDCRAINNTFSRDKLGLTNTPQGIPVQSDSGGDLNQAYTCVNIATDTNDYENTLDPHESDVIPLRTKDGAPFSEVQISWFKKTNSGSGDNYTFYPTFGEYPASSGAWGTNTPAVIRLQVISKPKSGVFSLSGINEDSKTIFLYPRASGGITSSSISPINDAGRRSQKFTTPEAASCSTSKDTGNGFACQFLLTGVDNSKEYYLRIAPYYNKTSFNITLQDGSGSPVKLNEVQTLIDSTGRASNVFRRTQVRLNPIDTTTSSLGLGFDSTDSICKDFSVATNRGDYVPATCGD